MLAALLNRRSLLAAILLGSPFLTRAARALDARVAAFVDMAFKMKRDAVQAGDQAYGAVVVRGEEIVGYGPSRVILKRDDTAHAEREAIRDAQSRLGADLSGCTMYSTSRPCPACEAAAAKTNIARMYFGERATDAGAPRAAR